jgi:hypothetical protein
MEFSMMYCTHCLQKLVKNQPVSYKQGEAYFFLPAMDSYQRAFLSLCGDGKINAERFA